MKLICGPASFKLPNVSQALCVVLYGKAQSLKQGCAGEAARSEILRRRLDPAPRSWDLLSIALSVVTADFAVLRDDSPDGWTREIELHIAVAEPDFWSQQKKAIEAALGFLTTDIWSLNFYPGGDVQPSQKEVVHPTENCVVLLSGGLDSLIGTIDLVSGGLKPFAISQTVRGDGEKQIQFAETIGGGLNHLQLNHNASSPGSDEPSQRARSLIFLAFGVVAATCLQQYHEGGRVPLYMCENGFIAINPPLTSGRIGSLSTRTAHPEFLSRFKFILEAAGLRVDIQNPYEEKTKGQMLLDCKDQNLLKKYAVHSTSCGRFQRFNYHHCGRCVPCQVRRAAFLTWDKKDSTGYVHDNLGKKDKEHAGFDDVRAVAIALAAARADGTDAWLDQALSYPSISNKKGLKDMLVRGLAELEVLHKVYKVT
ncbi:Qat anti-phage system QueC-like protein QatC [Cellvibrio fibrivorans]|uniref:7-cyano-7-deazaguanine synthase n=1 Tax=Cellvibrio fibrivorans TaxID=126350 RepID=A0ABU1UXP0_9GAMM|nr:Qat anti-phage system QueC-like protein QatC [Cellvibrio fibrivorans]MDR7089954.1 hypothetical protein [Cellvibrio fibrivorans]